MTGRAPLPGRGDTTTDARAWMEGIEEELGGLSATYLRHASRKVWALGDSNTAGSPFVVTSEVFTGGTGQGGLKFPPTTWVTWAVLASEARWTLAGVFATGGYTAAQIRSTHVPALIVAASPGDTVVVLAGTNGWVFADVQAIHDTLRAAGLRTVAVTLPPFTDAYSQIAEFNARLWAYALDQGIPVVDAFGTLVEPATGQWQASYLNDGIHANVTGYKALGRAVAAVLKVLFPVNAAALVQHNAPFAGNLQAKPLTVGGFEGYGAYTPLGTGTVAPVADADFLGGSALNFTRGDADIIGYVGVGYPFVAGHRIRIGFALKATGAFWQINLDSATTGTQVLWSLGHPNAMSVGTDGITRLYSEFVVPSLPDYGYRLQVALGGAGASLSIGEITLLDLTTLGAL